MSNLFKNADLLNLGFFLNLIAIIGDLLIPFILAPFYNKYNHLNMVMSLLGSRNSPVNILYSIWLVLAGIMLLLGNISLFTTYTKVSASGAIWLFAIITIYAVGGCILSGIFPVGETKELLTLSAKIHGYGSVLGFCMLTFAPLIIGILSMKSNDFAMGIISFILFALAILFFALFIMADKEKFAGTIISYEGLWQRLSLLCMYAPIFIVSLKKVMKV